MQTSYWSCLTYPIWPTVGFLVPQNTRKTTCFVQFFFFLISSVTTCLQLFKIRFFFLSLIKFCGLYEKIK